MSKAFDPSRLSALVLDKNHHHRLLTLEQLRLMGFNAVHGASTLEQAWELLIREKPQILLVEWLDPPEETLELVRRVRQSELSPNKSVSMFMLTNKGSLADVEAARKAGVDGYLRKPISAAAMQERVKIVVENPQPFIVTATYVGPCRRRRQDPAFAGPWRRVDDVVPEDTVPQSHRDAHRARQSVATLDARAKRFTPEDIEAAAELLQSARDLCTVSDDIADGALGFGARELVRYLEAQSATFRVDGEALRTHVTALYQLAHLPASLGAERERVAQSLKAMVDKKLRAA